MPKISLMWFRKSIAVAIIVSFGVVAAPKVFANSPILNVTQDGGSNVRLTITNAQPFANITLYSRQGSTQLWTIISNFGTTDQSGYFSSSIGIGSSWDSSPIEYYVNVNGQQSTTQIVYPGSNNNCGYNCGNNCNYNGYCGNNGPISLSQNNVNLSLNQSMSISVYGGSSYYISNNSNSNVVSASISGSSLSLYAYQTGSSVITVCSYQNQGCATVYVSVNSSGGNYGGQITFSQNNITLNYNQSTTVTVYGGYNNSYYISNNTNSNIVNASISGSQLNLYARNSGNAQITICSNNSSECGILYVTVGYGNGSNNNAISFGEVSPVVSVGQTRAIAIYGGYNNYSSNNYYVSSTTNNNIVSATISGSSLSLYGINNGSSTVTVCQSGNGCGSLYVSVVGYNNYNNGNYNYGSPYLTTTTLPTAYSGQYYSYQLQATGGSYPYTYAISSGNLPAGLSLSYTGYISGIPQCSGNRDFSVQVTDSAGRNSSRQLTLPMTNCGYGYGNGYGSGYVYGTSTYKNGSLIKENGTVYLVYKNTKTGFANANAFLGLGYSWANVQTTGYTGLTQSAYTVNTQYARHPWGTWIKAGNTIYFVHELGLIPVPSYEAFINNGGEDRLVVPANSYDFSGNILNPMDYGDSRLR